MPTATFYQPQSILAHRTGSATHNTLKDRHTVVFQEYIFSLGRWPFGWTHDLVFDNEEAYLERWIIWCGFTLRLHKFHKGDDDRAFHDHPWWFITLPLRSYTELTPLGQHRVMHGGHTFVHLDISTLCSSKNNSRCGLYHHRAQEPRMGVLGKW